MFLTSAQLEVLTGYRRPKKQKAALDAMGIAYRVRPDGRPVVLAESVGARKRMDGPRLDRVNVSA